MMLFLILPRLTELCDHLFCPSLIRSAHEQYNTRECINGCRSNMVDMCKR